MRQGIGETSPTQERSGRGFSLIVEDEPLVRTLAVDSDVVESVDADEAIKILGTRLGTRSHIEHCASARLSVERLLSVTNKIFSGNLHWEVLSWAGRA